MNDIVQEANKVRQIQQRAECAGKEHQRVKQDGQEQQGRQVWNNAGYTSRHEWLTSMLGSNQNGDTDAAEEWTTPIQYNKT